MSSVRELLIKWLCVLFSVRRNVSNFFSLVITHTPEMCEMLVKVVYSFKYSLLIPLAISLSTTHTQTHLTVQRTLILLPAVVGRPFFSALRFSGNRARIKALLRKNKPRQTGIIMEEVAHMRERRERERERSTDKEADTWDDWTIFDSGH